MDATIDILAKLVAFDTVSSRPNIALIEWVADRLADMDIAGIEASACFPNTLVRFCGQRFLYGKDKDLALLCVQAYNDYMVEEWCADSGGVLIPLIIIPLCFLTVGIQTAVNAGSGVVRLRWRTYTLAMIPGCVAWALMYGLGMLAVWHAEFISPATVSFGRSAMAVVMVILGGTGALLGPLVGAGVVVGFEHLISSYVDRWPTLLGLAFILVVMFLPNGIIGQLRSRLRSAPRRSQAPEALEMAP